MVLPEGTLVNARFPRAVAAGNVETSQRIVDVLLGAFGQALPDRVPAASQGTMNNITIGGGGSADGRTLRLLRDDRGRDGRGARARTGCRASTST